MHALRCTPNTSLGNYLPSALVFQHDMFLNLPLITDIITLTRNRQAQIDRRLLRINARCLHHEYAVGQSVYKLNFGRDKLDPVCHGPFPILRVHTNNTVTIKIGPIHERISIRHLTLVRPS